MKADRQEGAFPLARVIGCVKHRNQVWMAALLGLSLCVALTALSACARVVPPSRVLPSHIKRIYVREFKNNSRIYGASADLTLYVNDEFISDGRLDVVQSARSDARLEGVITQYNEQTAAISDDRIPVVMLLQMTCMIELWDPYDADRIVPMARYTVPAAVQYVSDPRRSYAEMDTEVRKRLLQQMAVNIVQTVITGQPEAPRPIEQKAIQKYQQRRSPNQFEPVLTQPRFPKPTPAP
ncbi:MAG: LPS assembly lipoprotein LptE [bacterium]